MKYILRYMKPLAGRIMGGMSIKLFGTVMDLLIPYILAHIIDQVTPRHDVKLVLLWGGIMIVCSFLAWLGNAWRRAWRAIARAACGTICLTTLCICKAGISTG